MGWKKGQIEPAASILVMGVTEDLEKFRLRRSHHLLNSTAAVAIIIGLSWQLAPQAIYENLTECTTTLYRSKES